MILAQVRSHPWLPSTSRTSLGRLASKLAQGTAKALKVAELQKMSNMDWFMSGLKDENEELQNFAANAPPDVKPICERMGAYKLAPASELP